MVETEISSNTKPNVDDLENTNKYNIITCC